MLKVSAVEIRKYRVVRNVHSFFHSLYNFVTYLNNNLSTRRTRGTSGIKPQSTVVAAVDSELESCTSGNYLFAVGQYSRIVSSDDSQIRIWMVRGRPFAKDQRREEQGKYSRNPRPLHLFGTPTSLSHPVSHGEVSLSRRQTDDEATRWHDSHRNDVAFRGTFCTRNFTNETNFPWSVLFILPPIYGRRDGSRYSVFSGHPSTLIPGIHDRRITTTILPRTYWKPTFIESAFKQANEAKERRSDLLEELIPAVSLDFHWFAVCFVEAFFRRSRWFRVNHRYRKKFNGEAGFTTGNLSSTRGGGLRWAFLHVAGRYRMSSSFQRL